MQHPYKDLQRLLDSSSSMNRKQAVILRSLALVKVLLGCAIVSCESISKFQLSKSSNLWVDVTGFL